MSARPVLIGLAAVSAISCNDIVERRLSTAPVNASNEFACENYRDTPVKATPSDGRCLVSTVTFDFSILVSVPDTAEFGAGQSFVVPSKPLTRDGPDLRVKLPVVGNVVGSYVVRGSDIVQEGQSIPIHATFSPLGSDDRTTYDPALPLQPIFASSEVIDTESTSIATVRSLSAGRWSHVFEPSPPYDESFPPHFGALSVKRLGDSFDIANVQETNGGFDDPPPGTSREAKVTRAEGLEGWTAWLQDHATKQRISTLARLCRPDAQGTPACIDGTEARTRLETVGRGTSLVGVDAVVSPPAGYIGVPRLVVELIQGFGLSNLAYPELKDPIAFHWNVATSTDGGPFLSVASRVTFESESITLPSGAAQPLLKYSTTASTDDRGNFATVLPPGTYTVTVEPLEGTGFASFRKQVVIEQSSPITLSPPRRTHVRGLAVLSDGRPAGNAEVLALPDPAGDTPARPRPRPGRSRVREDGTFALDLDQGAYLLTVVPEDGTGFPRVVTRATIPVNEADVGVIRIPPPSRLGLVIVDPTNLAGPIQSANVRIFASPEGGGAPVEIGLGITNSLGKVEILLAQQPK